jgi:hypothetical protein
VVDAPVFPVEGLEGPDDAIVIAIRDTDALQDPEARHRPALRQQLEQFQAQFAGETVVVLVYLDS